MAEQIWTDVDAYFEEWLLPADPELDATLANTAAAAMPDIAVSPSQGKLLQLLALAQGARRILEVGTLGGYSGIWLARALPPDGRLVTLELNPHHAEVARANFVRAGLADRVEQHVGPALETLARLRSQAVAPFDLVFIDADKPNNPGYVEAALGLSRPGTMIIVDNVARGGAVIRSPTEANAAGVRRMVEWVAKEPRLSATVVQTVGRKGYDGFLLARVV